MTNDLSDAALLNSYEHLLVEIAHVTILGRFVQKMYFGLDLYRFSKSTVHQ